MARYIDADKFREKAFYADTEADINHYIRLYGYADIVPKSEVEKIFEEIEKTLNRKISRSKPQFEKLKNREDLLSKFGYEDMGYFQSIISTCEDLQDLIDELKKKYEKKKQ